MRGSRTLTSAFARGSRCAGPSWGRSRRSTSMRPAGVRDYAERYQGIYSGIFPFVPMARRLERAGHGHNRVRAARTLGRRQARRAPGVAGSPLDRACRAQALGGQEHRRLTNGVETRNDRSYGSVEQGHHHLRCDGGDPHAVNVAIPSRHRRPDRRGRDRRGGSGAAIVHLHARDDKPAGPTKRPRPSRAFCRASSSRQGGGESDHRRRAVHDGARSASSPRRLSSRKSRRSTWAR